MSVRDRDGDPIGLSRIEPRNESERILEELIRSRNAIADLIDEFEAIALLVRRAPQIAETGEWREDARRRLREVAERLNAIAQGYGGD